MDNEGPPNTDNDDALSVNLDLHFPDKNSTFLETSTILSDLSEDNDMPAYTDLNGLLTWLTDGQKQLKSKVQQRTLKTKAMACKICGPYKLKGTIQLQQT